MPPPTPTPGKIGLINVQFFHNLKPECVEIFSTNQKVALVILGFLYLFLYFYLFFLYRRDSEKSQ